jgi:hypothetical protein
MQEIKSGKLDENSLYLNRPPESFSDPKNAIETAIRIALSGKTKRKRNELKIDDLYDILGQKIDLESLRRLDSFNKFESEVTNSFRKMGLIS